MKDKALNFAFGAQNTGLSYYEYTLAGNVGAEKIDPKYTIKRDLNWNAYLDLIDNNTATSVLRLSRTQISEFFDLIYKKGYTENTYPNVKDNLAWRTVYDVKQYQFDYVYKNTNVLAKKGLDGTYCRVCRIVIPLKNLTVDHQKPQKGGEDAALFKIFRGYGLTKGGPIGPKGQVSVNAYAKFVGGAINPAGNPTDRNTTNVQGSIYYSILKGAHLLADFKHYSLHHYLNLAPVCNSCNSRKSNLF